MQPNMLPIKQLLDSRFRDSPGAKYSTKDNKYNCETKDSQIKISRSLSRIEYKARYALDELEPNKPSNLGLYISRVCKIPDSLVYQFVSEVKQDGTITNPGAMFITKCDDYIRKNHL